MSKKYLKWEEVDSLWNNTNYLWEDVAVLIEIDNIVKRSGGDYSSYFKGNPWNKISEDINEDKLKRVIRIFCEYKGIEYTDEKVYKRDDIIITAKEFEIFIKESIKERIKINVSF